MTDTQTTEAGAQAPASGLFIYVNNWDGLQHYKHPHPAWIKLYTRLITQWQYQQLSYGARATLVGLWCLAARTNNEQPLDHVYIARQLALESALHSEIFIEQLVKFGFVCIGPPGGMQTTLPGLEIPYSNALDSPEKKPIASKRESKRQSKSKNKQKTSPESETRETWLTLFGARWRHAYGGAPHWGQLAKQLRPLVDTNGAAKVLTHFEHWLDATPAQYASLAKFASTFGAWEKPSTRNGTKITKRSGKIDERTSAKGE